MHFDKSVSGDDGGGGGGGGDGGGGDIGGASSSRRLKTLRSMKMQLLHMKGETRAVFVQELEDKNTYDISI